MPENPSMSFTGTLEFENPPKLWALTKGGRAIPPLVSPPNFLLDSNAVTYLKNRAKLLSPEKAWWDTLLEDNTTVLNPVPNAVEGNSGLQAPSRDEFEQRFAEDVKMLREEFPKVRVTEYDHAAFDGVYDMVRKIADENERENDFLLATAPLIRDDVKQQDRAALEAEILEIARAHGLRSDSFALYSILSCLYSSGSGFQIARKILKPTALVEKNSAHNALTDISLVRLVTATFAYFTTPEWPPFALVTADQYLIAFWCALGLNNFRVNHDGTAEADFSFSEPMFPTLDANGRHELSKRVANL